MNRLHPFYNVRSIPTLLVCGRNVTPFLTSPSLLQRQVYSNVDSVATQYAKWTRNYKVSPSLLQRQVYSNVSFADSWELKFPGKSPSLLQRQVYSNKKSTSNHTNQRRKSPSLLQRQVYSNFNYSSHLPGYVILSPSLLQRQVYSNENPPWLGQVWTT